jgi:1,4-dihydroxy-2-naphthoate octaprenyltransferase
VRYGAWGFGLGESGLFLALGLIPAIGAYYGQTQTVDALALWSALPFALLVSLMGIAFNLVNARRDWLIRKRTLAVALGFGRAIDLTSVLLIAAFVTIIFTAIVSDLPLRTLVAVLALPIATGAYGQLDREQLPPAQGMRLYTAAIQCTLVAGLLYTLALFTDRLW